MKDTSPDIEEKVYEMIRKKTPQERVQIGVSMNQTSRILVSRAILRNNPGISEKEFREKLFIQFYGNDFSDQEKAEILLHLSQHSK